MRRGGTPVLIGVLALMSPVLAACGDDGGTTAEAATNPTISSTSSATSIAATLPLTDAPSTTRVAAVAVTVPRTTATVAHTTLAPTTTARSTTTIGLTTVETLAPTTVPLPVPAPPPAPRADEPFIDLGTIEIPKIGVTKPLLEGITLNTLDLGPGHWPGTAMPGGIGNAVIAGHRTSHDKPFRNIDQLAAGDEVIFTTADGRFVYTVTATTIVAPDAMYIIDQTPTPTATLFACHPPGSTRQRIVVSLALVQ